MINAFSRGLAQLNDPNIRKIIWITIFSACVAFILLWILIGTLLSTTSLFSISWLEWVADLMGGLATLILTWFLFPPLICVIIAVFLPDIVSAVETRYYPGLEPPAKQSVMSTLIIAFRYLGVLVVVNFALLALLILGPLFPFVFYSINGYLLGREYFELVALRRLPHNEAKRLYQLHRGELFVAGVVMSISLTLPLINLLAPVVITASMVHLFEDWRNTSSKVIS